MMRTKLVAANWKMNGQRADNEALLKALLPGLADVGDVEVLVCPPSVYLEQVAALLAGTGVHLGAQNIHTEKAGAFTGEISAPMLADFGCSHVIIGHSERRELFAESDAFIAGKFVAAQASGLIPVLCIGETRQQREAGRTGETVLAQLQSILEPVGIGAFDKAVIAYEPVWAIGTGLTATPEQAQDVHALIRQRLAQEDDAIADLACIIYGGSVKAANAAELFMQPDIDGALVGGASLIAADFEKICASMAVV